MKNLVHDFPLPVDFQQREKVREPVTGPVVEFKPQGGDGARNVDAGDACFEVRRWAIRVIPCEELVDRARRQFVTDIAEDRGACVKGGFHVVTSAGPGTIDVVLNHLGDRFMLASFAR